MWRLGNGSLINLWKDMWILNAGFLEDKVMAPISDLIRTMRVLGIFDRRGARHLSRI